MSFAIDVTLESQVEQFRLVMHFQAKHCSQWMWDLNYSSKMKTPGDELIPCGCKVKTKLDELAAHHPPAPSLEEEKVPQSANWIDSPTEVGDASS